MKPYISMMDEALVEKEAGREAKYHPLRPSSAGKCARLLAWQLAAYNGQADIPEETKSGRILRLLDLGHYAEEQIIAHLKMLKGYNVRFNQQVVDLFNLPSGHTVEGSTDVALWSEEDKCLIDVKTIGDRFHSVQGTKWRGLLKDYDNNPHCEKIGEAAYYIEDLEAFVDSMDKEDSLYDNLLQLNSYACSDFFHSRGLKQAAIVRYNKNDSSLSEIRFKPSIELFNRLREKYILIERAVYEDENPDKAPMEFTLGSVKCAYCPMKSHCHPSAGKRDFYKGKPKEWAKRTDEVKDGDELEGLLMKRAVLESNKQALEELDDKIILLLTNQNIRKIKTSEGDVYDVVTLAKGQELRRGKE